MNALRILGIDPGSNATGFGVVEDIGRRGDELRHVAHGTIRPPRGGALSLRLHVLQRALREAIERYAPEIACVEEVFVATSPRSALVLGQARGALLACVGEAGLTLVEYAPARIKLSVTGSGRAPKLQVQRMVARRLGLETAPAADAADALAAAICHAQMDASNRPGSPHASDAAGGPTSRSG